MKRLSEDTPNAQSPKKFVNYPKQTERLQFGKDLRYHNCDKLRSDLYTLKQEGFVLHPEGEPLVNMKESCVYKIRKANMGAVNGLTYANELDSLMFTGESSIVTMKVNSKETQQFCSAPQVTCITCGSGYLAYSTSHNYISIMKLSTKVIYTCPAVLDGIQAVQILEKEGTIYVNVRNQDSLSLDVAEIIEDGDNFQLKNCIRNQKHERFSCLRKEKGRVAFYDGNQNLRLILPDTLPTQHPTKPTSKESEAEFWYGNGYICIGYYQERTCNTIRILNLELGIVQSISFGERHKVQGVVFSKGRLFVLEGTFLFNFALR